MNGGGLRMKRWLMGLVAMALATGADRLWLLLPEVSKQEPLCMQVVRDGNELLYRDEHATPYRGVVLPPRAKGLP